MSATVNVSLSFTKSGVSDAFSSSQTATMAVAGYKVQVPTFGTAASQISTATVNTLGYAYLQSLVTTTQATCTLTFGRLDGTAFSPVVKLLPNEPAVLRLAPGNYAAQGAAEGYRLLVAILEE
jgi:flagellar capping protein FliD